MTRVSFQFKVISTLVLYVAVFGPTSNCGYIVKRETDQNGQDEGKENVPEYIEPKIYELKVFSNVSNRFANTVITSKVINLAQSAQEATFSVVLPETAYISGFTMEVDGKNYTASVKEKKEAKQEYGAAVAGGQSAAHVESSARDSNRFTVSVNVEPEKKATFYLTYEELLKRKEYYELVINIHPKQPVEDLSVEVFIHESKPLKYVKTSPIRSGNDVRQAAGDLDPRSTITKLDNKTTIVNFNPNEKRQKELAHVLGTKEDEGLSGQFVVQYEVEREANGGEVLIKDGYFVHFFAPSDLPPLPKHVVFVLDTSGSMGDGKKMPQLKDAMKSILSELKEEDLLNIVEFSSKVKALNIGTPDKNVEFPKGYSFRDDTTNEIDAVTFPRAVPANETNIKQAQSIIDSLNAFGGTNIYESLRVGVRILEQEQDRHEHEDKKKRHPLLIFLTDGEPTVGLTNENQIESRLSEFNIRSVPIFTLSFGDGANDKRYRKFLNKLSLNNNGFTRHIYEAADATLQLENFYKEISSPLMNNVTFSYTEEVSKMTNTRFPLYFGGSEVVIAGQIDSGPRFTRPPTVEGWTAAGQKSLATTYEEPVGSLERLWAYLTIQQLLQDKESDKNKRKENEKKALDIALQYSFVTPITSLVVVKPNNTVAVETERADQKPKIPEYDISSSPQQSYPVVNIIANYPGTYDPVSSQPQSYHRQSYQPQRYYPQNYHPQGYQPQSYYPQSYQPQSYYSQSYQPQSYNYQPPSYHTPSYSLPVYSAPDHDIFSFSSPKNIMSLDIMANTYGTPSMGSGNVYGGLQTFASGSPHWQQTTQNPGIGQISILLLNLPWLRNIMNPNQTITFQGGVYQLDTRKSLIQPFCSNPPRPAHNGHCKLLMDCDSVHLNLIDASVYGQHFCSLEGIYAGVCCPDSNLDGWH